MTFMIYSLNLNEMMSARRPSKPLRTDGIDSANAARPISRDDHGHASAHHEPHEAGVAAYTATARLSPDVPVVAASQIMSKPVVTVTPDTNLTDALKQFQSIACRHLPVALASGRLVGIVSERDILRFLANQTVDKTAADTRVEHVMTPRVLTVTVDTDVRHIARVFVEQRIGALPVVSEDVMQGIITRSDVLHAVIHHYTLELWA